MKNKFTILLSLSLILFVAMGCGMIDYIGSSDSGETTLDKTSDSTSTSEKKKEATPSGEKIIVGITECDELATYVNDNTEEIEGSYVGKALMYFYRNTILKSLQDGVGKMNDEEKKKWADVCTKTLKDLKENMQK
ncbi:MAG: hypothetical protein M3405_15935 [Acidobacteriota bacterium]|jgi:hypothetical protein|nr:hypothetical protein [Acidobacteriota bacterium]